MSTPAAPKLLLLPILFALLAGCSATQSQEPHWNKPGINDEIFMADSRACMIYGQEQANIGGGNLIYTRSYRGCMNAKGYLAARVPRPSRTINHPMDNR